MHSPTPLVFSFSGLSITPILDILFIRSDFCTHTLLMESYSRLCPLFFQFYFLGVIYFSRIFMVDTQVSRYVLCSVLYLCYRLFFGAPVRRFHCNPFVLVLWFVSLMFSWHSIGISQLITTVFMMGVFPPYVRSSTILFLHWTLYFEIGVDNFLVQGYLSLWRTSPSLSSYNNQSW